MLRSEGFQKYFKNTSWLFIERVVRLLVVLLTGIYVARYLGDELLGQISYAAGFVGLFLAFSSMGLDEIIVRDLVRHPEKRDEYLGTAAVIKICGALIVVTLVTISAFMKGMDQLTTALVIVIAVAETTKFLDVIDYHFLARVRSKRSMQVQMVQVFVSAAIKITLILLQADLIYFAWVYVVEGAVLSLGYAVAYKADGFLLRAWRSSKKNARYLLSQSWPLIVYGMALFIQTRIDQVMLGDMLGRRIGQAAANAEVGQYSVALKMIEALAFLPVIIQKSLAPAVTQAKLKGEALYRDRLLNQYRLMFLIFLVTAIPLYLLSEPLIVFLYGEEFRPAGFLLSLFSIRLIFANMGMAKASFITNESLFKYSLLTAVVGATINIVMNYLLIPDLKAIGAIWATIASFGVSIFLMDLVFRNTRWNFRLMMLGIITFWKIDRVK